MALAFLPVTVGQYTTDPNKWTFDRVNGVAAILDETGATIDEPTDTGQSDFDLRMWGIGWLHTTLKGD